jgi:hypothetical protein
MQRRRNVSRSMASCIHESIEVPSANAKCLTMSYRSSGSAMVVFARGRLPAGASAGYYRHGVSPRERGQ